MLVVPNGSTVRIHNVNTGDWNREQSPGSKPLSQVIKYTGRPFVQVNCGFHSWMRRYIYVTKSPYFTVTEADGSFRIDNIPPGKYKVTANHPSLGRKRARLTFDTYRPVSQEFTFKP